MTPLFGAAVAGSLLQEWWDRISPASFAHRDGRQQRYLPMWRKTWLDSIADECAGKRFVEYGIGEGYLGEYALVNLSVAHYAGIDVSSKSLEAARRHLARVRASGSWKLHAEGVALSSLQPDVFVSQQVIQHFPSREYTDAFLAQVNSSGAAIAMLHTKLPRKIECSGPSRALGYCSATSGEAPQKVTRRDANSKLHNAVCEHSRIRTCLALYPLAGHALKSSPSRVPQSGRWW